MSRIAPSTPALLRRLLCVLAVGATCATGAATPAEEAAGTAARGKTTFEYVVEPGDTLWSIAEAMLGRGRAWPRLQRYNRLDAEAPLRPGMRLAIPVTWLERVARSGVVTHAAGDVTVAGFPVFVGRRFRGGVEIRTGGDGFASIELDDGSKLQLLPHSVLRVEEITEIAGTRERDVRLHLERGKASKQVAPRVGGSRYVIRTPTAAAAVRGTEFRVAFEANASRVEVLDGSVAFGTAGARDRDVALAAGFGASVDSRGQLGAPVQLPPAPALGALPAEVPFTAIRFSLAAAGQGRWVAQVASDAGFRQVVAAAASDANRDIAFGALPLGEYWLQVRAVTPEGIEGLDAVHRFRVTAAAPPPAPPAAPPAVPEMKHQTN